jgi:hypothetical protein
MHGTNSIPRGRSPLLPVGPVNSLRTREGGAVGGGGGGVGAAVGQFSHTFDLNKTLGDGGAAAAVAHVVDLRDARCSFLEAENWLPPGKRPSLLHGVHG